jgi:DNA-binding CsgD family transcriptional regulator
MDSDQAAAIDLVEASYDLERPAAEWLPNLLRVAEPLLDLGMGYYGTISKGVNEEGVPVLTQVLGSRGAEDLPMKVMRAAQEVGPDVVRPVVERITGTVSLLSDLAEQHPEACEAITRNAGCKDFLSLTAIDPDGQGVNISVPSAQIIELGPKQKRRFQMLGVHLSAGHRLRRGLGEQSTAPGAPMTDIPLNAEALVDPARFVVSEAVGIALQDEAAKSIREAARVVDQARGPLRERDPEEALRVWQGLVRGRWSLVDWFDTDGRRFILAKPNAPHIIDPRGLSGLEAQVATYASRGDSSKMVGYRLGLSQSYVSRLLRDAMRKLGVKTQPQLVEKMRGAPSNAA